MRLLPRLAVLAASLLLLAGTVHAEAGAEPLRILLVTAHPDDEAVYSATVYRLTHTLGATADLAILTNGEGGYKYSDLAESIYGLELTREEVGRAHLPGIRKRELLAAGEVLNIRNYFFFDQKDTEYTLELEPVFAAWDLDFIRQRMRSILRAETYDYVFVMLPTDSTHAHHRASAIFALEAVAEMPAETRPIVLGVRSLSKEEAASYEYRGFPGFPVTTVAEDAPRLEFDRSRPFGARDRLNHHIIVNWVIAEHKSQGTMQMLMNRDDIERFFYFALNSDAGRARAQALFDRLGQKTAE